MGSEIAREPVALSLSTCLFLGSIDNVVPTINMHCILM